ncbi:hypothetical protein F4677DRAFT_407378 [Hypoxylon crocopeplum]|nr:hypothetical protein F4677DRAFT_407378 [Hypoxylon crocopeplum]
MDDDHTTDDGRSVDEDYTADDDYSGNDGYSGNDDWSTDDGRSVKDNTTDDDRTMRGNITDDDRTMKGNMTDGDRTMKDNTTDDDRTDDDRSIGNNTEGNRSMQDNHSTNDGHIMDIDSPENVDWDEQLLSRDWANQDWREVILLLNNVPWERLRRSTVLTIVNAHAEYNQRHPEADADLSPAEIEYFRRLRLESVSPEPVPGMSEDRSMLDWVSSANQQSENKSPEGSPRKRQQQREEANAVSKQYQPGFLTIGFELELAIAGRRAGDIFAERPHPNDTRWEAEDILVDNDTARLQRTAVNQVISVLNSQTDFVVIRKDEDEGEVLHDERMATLRWMDEGALPMEAGPDGSPIRGRGPPNNDVARAAQDALDNLHLINYFNPEQGRDIRLLSEADIRRAVNSVSRFNLQGARDVENARRHLIDLIRLESYRLKRDPRHIYLVGMKPRYRAFSVYPMGDADANMIYVRGQDYARQAGTHPPVDPQKQYEWVMAKVSSPVLPLRLHENDDQDLKNVATILSILCRTLRNNFRIHRELPSIPTTAQINVSHSAGFSLTEIKKLITLVAVTHGDIVKIHRQWRTSSDYERVCGPVQTTTNLGSISFTNTPGAPSNDPKFVLPHPTAAEEKTYEQTMNEYVDVGLLFEGHNKLTDRVFFNAVWRCESVDQISYGLNTGMKWRKPEVITKCVGPFEHTENVELDEEELLDADQKQVDLTFNNVDAERGVFEFRHCSGTMNPEHIFYWLAFVIHLVNFVKISTPAEYKRVLTGIMTGQLPLMEAFNVPDEVQNFFVNNIRDGFYNPENEPPVSWDDPFWPRV